MRQDPALKAEFDRNANLIAQTRANLELQETRLVQQEAAYKDAARSVSAVAKAADALCVKLESSDQNDELSCGIM